MPSQLVAQLVDTRDHASEACELIVHEARDCWRREEGSYRDDITAIITYLPFLEEWSEEAAVADADGGGGNGGEPVLINQGARGITKLDAGAAVSLAAAADEAAGASQGQEAKSGDDDSTFHRRRLSVAHPYGEDGDDWEDEEADEVAAK